MQIKEFFHQLCDRLRMPSMHQLLQDARDCYVRAKRAKTEKSKNALIAMGDQLWARAEELDQDQRYYSYAEALRGEAS
ncbi:MAG TPA: hypothetical protein VFB45_25140 [Pseudolabrys sp.]|nr:hypothetical protein [Pseudolabrys sp.]